MKKTSMTWNNIAVLPEEEFKKTIKASYGKIIKQKSDSLPEMEEQLRSIILKTKKVCDCETKIQQQFGTCDPRSWYIYMATVQQRICAWLSILIGKPIVEK